MDVIYKILAVVIIGFLLWRMVGFIKQNPEQFTFAKINQGMMTMGIIALILIGFIAFLIFLLRG